MGNSAAYGPSTSKQTETACTAAGSLRCAVSSMKGWRPTMEDQHVIELELPHLSDHSLFCVFDGHGGSFASGYLKKNFLRVLHLHLQTYRALSKPKRSNAHGILRLKEALHKAFHELDELLRNADQPSGSTAVVVLLTPSHIVTANVGDSRAILRRYGTVIPLSFDHKPHHILERIRIVNSGFRVRNRRVNGVLSVSRAFGDFGHKPAVIVDPDFTVYPRDNAGDEFIVLACDGVFDVASNRECGEFVQHLLSKGKMDMGSICEEALDVCLERRSRDNITMILVGLPAIKADYSATSNDAAWGERMSWHPLDVLQATQNAAKALARDLSKTNTPMLFP